MAINYHLLIFSFILVITLCSPSAGQKVIKSKNEIQCPYDNEDILSAILASVVVTIIITGITLFIAWLLWKRDYINLGPFVTKSKILNKRCVNKASLLKKSDLETGHEYAFDNPYFKNDDMDTQINGAIKSAKNMMYQEKAGFDHSKAGTTTTENGTHQNNGIISNYHQNCKRLIKSLPIINVLNHVSKQDRSPPKAHDDTCLTTKPEQVAVELTGHDFTGLGFNICGNMRDGIFIKDVLTRGPANESGLIKTGDRIVSITVMFDKMVYEDALTILSYASPYNVQLKIEKNSNKSSNCSNTSMIPKRLADVNTNCSNQRLLHPLYRSHSVENFLVSEKNSPVNDKGSGTIKTHKMFQKIKTNLLNRSWNKSTLIDKAKLSLSTESRSNLDPKKRYSCDTSSLVKNSIVIEMTGGSQKEVVKFENNLVQAQGPTVLSQYRPASNTDEIDQSIKPLPAPRKATAGGKRKAPKPPQVIATKQCIESWSSPELKDNLNDKIIDKVNQSLHLETQAQVHQEASVPLSSEVSLNEQDEQEEQKDKSSGPQAKLKSCSLSDLCNVDSKKKSNLLERAVSLDFKTQQLSKLQRSYMVTSTLIHINH